MKKLLLYSAIYLGIFCIFTILFIGFLYSSIFDFQHVLFYRGLMYLVVTFTLILLCIGVYARYKSTKYIESFIAALVVSASIHLNIFVVFPVTFERSISMYLLSTLEKNRGTACGGLTKDQMQGALVNTYVTDHDAVGKRIEEQSIIKMIEESNGCFRATQRVTRLLRVADWMKGIYKY